VRRFAPGMGGGKVGVRVRNHPECLDDPQVWYLDLGLAPDLDLT